jgi:hypothetical protein
VPRHRARAPCVQGRGACSISGRGVPELYRPPRNLGGPFAAESTDCLMTQDYRGDRRKACSARTPRGRGSDRATSASSAGHRVRRQHVPPQPCDARVHRARGDGFVAPTSPAAVPCASTAQTPWQALTPPRSPCPAAKNRGCLQSKRSDIPSCVTCVHPRDSRVYNVSSPGLCRPHPGVRRRACPGAAPPTWRETARCVPPHARTNPPRMPTVDRVDVLRDPPALSATSTAGRRAVSVDAPRAPVRPTPIQSEACAAVSKLFPAGDLLEARPGALSSAV